MSLLWFAAWGKFAGVSDGSKADRFPQLLCPCESCSGPTKRIGGAILDGNKRTDLRLAPEVKFSACGDRQTRDGPYFFEIGMGRFLWGVEYCVGAAGH